MIEHFLGLTSTKQRIKCLAQGHNLVLLGRLKPATPQLSTLSRSQVTPTTDLIEPRHEISNNVACATSKTSDQPPHMRILIRAFASHLNIL